ncbi:MAG TPA: hypothetical protein VN026_12815 [Bacteroidia bacterium]|jgi:hypothetical protein|nr:hypothetical protein [Bacteroidia bacterium]
MDNLKTGSETTSGTDDTQNTASTEVENNTPAVNEATTEQPLSDLASVVETIRATSTQEITSLRAIPLGQPVDTTPLVPFEEAIILDEDMIDRDVVFEVVASKSQRGFSEIVDKKRGVKPYQAKDGKPFILPFGVTGNGKSEGGTITSYYIEKETNFRFHSANNKDQVTLMLKNGKTLIGYVSKGVNKEGKVVKRTFYFPRNLAKNVIDVPVHGQTVNLQVLRMLVG